MSYYKFREGLGWVMLSSREVGGWGLILTGLFIFYLGFEMGLEKPVNLCACVLFGVVVFRGGIHLLKVAVAAKVCQQAQDQLYPAAPPGGVTALVRQPANPGERAAKH